MSASQDKRKRQQQRAEGTDKRSIAEREAMKNKKKSDLRWTVTAVVLLLFIAVIIVANTNLFHTGTKSISIGDYKYTNAEYGYFYKTAYYKFCEDNRAYLSMLLDTKKPLSKQKVSADKTWADHFREAALSNMTQITAQHDAAIKEGYKLSEEDKARMDKEIDGLKQQAEYYKFASLDKYIAQMYGKGANEQTVRKLMEITAIASEYSKNKFESFKYTDKELKDEYAANANEFDTYNYSYIFVANAKKPETPAQSPAADAASPAPSAAAQSAAPAETQTPAPAETDPVAEKAAEDILNSYKESVKDKEDLTEADRAAAFKKAVLAVKSEGGDVTRTNYPGQSAKNADAAVFDWIKDTNRKAGDVATISVPEKGYYVVLFGFRSTNDYLTAKIRHILILAKDDNKDGKTDAEEIAAAKKTAEELYATWQKGDKSEESFAKLANEKSEDPGSNTKGGFYENIFKGQMPALNSFIFDADRKPGDTEIVPSDENYKGFHIVFYSGQGGTYADHLADIKLRNKAYADWSAEFVKDWTPKINNFIMWFAER
ncbi:MAG: hypothetical protein GX684_00495 [Ruminococcaceae bacterium]|nr:hypothetical protein [Oscillospiraceae bacterium]